ncbi:iron complex transport system permease protein [Ruminiclostridium sufflavum DSM 19573]|uniref:Iron complex transport system permease protein n=1 Tax=Ruminiclostridium sufflavum DSM 19573 TaxID=1121337 RepID=A0A318XN91_9FIRM|nr:iron chelate uptake ABC transporter family permease subunit [Ruminiclostridium sufflavum]PYG89076.1 iron complex transport system permease protein [Ruminiclostridium sufflavum DSM 19573]
MSYFQKKLKYNLLLLIAFGILVFIMLISCTIGIADIGIFNALKILVSKIPGIGLLIGGDSINSTYKMIVLDIRMPRIVLAAAIGAILAAVGGCFQGLFRNPMADPYVLGISNGAGLGAAIAIAFGMDSILWGAGMVPFLAFAGALTTTVVVYAIANVGGRLPSANLLLSGVAVGLFEYSLITILMILRRDKIEGIFMWLMGSVNAASWQQAAFLTPIAIIGVIAVCLFARDLNVISSNEETARSLGVKVETVKKLLLGVCSLLIAVCVSVSGIIGFVGLVVPHCARLITGSDHRVMLPFSAIGGAIFLVICDTLARSLMPPSELPVGAVTSLFGAPYFIYLLIKSKKKVRQ